MPVLIKTGMKRLSAVCRRGMEYRGRLVDGNTAVPGEKPGLDSLRREIER
jgi:hypothetical protein